MSRKAFPAAVPVSIGCSVALRMAPLAFTARTNILKITDAASQPVDPRDHQHVTGVKKIQYRLSKGKPAAGGLVGRTVWDVLADAWMSRRWWLIAFVAIALLLGLAISHVQTRPGKDVSLFGISLYTKGGASDLRENR